MPNRNQPALTTSIADKLKAFLRLNKGEKAVAIETQQALYYTQPYSLSEGAITRLEVTNPKAFYETCVYQAKPMFIAEDILHYFSCLYKESSEYGYCLFPNVSASELIASQNEGGSFQSGLPYLNFVICDREHLQVLNTVKLTKGLIDHPPSEANDFLSNKMFMSDISLHHIDHLPFIRNDEIRRVFIEAEHRLTHQLGLNEPICLLDDSEHAFYKLASDQVEEYGYHMFAKASLEALIDVADSIDDHSEAVKHYHKIANKTVDFIICDPVTLKVLACCNFDDKEDLFEQSALLMSGIPLYQISKNQPFSTVCIAEMLEDISNHALNTAQTYQSSEQDTDTCSSPLKTEVA